MSCSTSKSIYLPFSKFIKLLQIIFNEKNYSSDKFSPLQNESTYLPFNIQFDTHNDISNCQRRRAIPHCYFGKKVSNLNFCQIILKLAVCEQQIIFN